MISILMQLDDRLLLSSGPRRAVSANMSSQAIRKSTSGMTISQPEELEPFDQHVLEQVKSSRALFPMEFNTYNYQLEISLWADNVESLAYFLTNDRNHKPLFEECLTWLGQEKSMQEYRLRLDHFLCQVEARVSNDPISWDHYLCIRKLRRWPTLTHTTFHVLLPWKPGSAIHSANDIRCLDSLLNPPPEGFLDIISNEKVSILDVEKPEPAEPHLKSSEMRLIMDFLYQSPEFRTFIDHVNGMSKQHDFLVALLNKDLGRAQELLAEEFEAIGTFHYSWLRELRELGHEPAEIAEMLLDHYEDAPWIVVDRQIVPKSTIVNGKHAQLCAHDREAQHRKRSHLGTSEQRLSHDPRLDISSGETKMLFNSSMTVEKGNLRRAVAGLCGLAGIVPISHDRCAWRGQVDFHTDDPTATVTYALPNVEYSNANMALISRICEALEGFLQAAGHLQEAGACCDCFTILHISSTASVQEVAELSRIGFYIPGLLLAQLRSLQKHFDMCFIPSDLQETRTLALTIVTNIWPNNQFAALDAQGNDESSTVDEILHLSALVVQLLCLGFLSFSQAHCGAIQPFFLLKPIKTVWLQGIQGDGGQHLQIIAQLNELTCIGDMLHEPVLVFSTTQVERSELLRRSRTKLDLIACSEDLMDTWGPGRFLFTPSSTGGQALRSVEIGGGAIRVGNREGTVYHW